MLSFTLLCAQEFISLGYLRRSADLSGDLLNFLRDVGGRAAQQYRRVAR